jgi:hypothetical protein
MHEARRQVFDVSHDNMQQSPYDIHYRHMQKRPDEGIDQECHTDPPRAAEPDLVGSNDPG